MILTHCHSLWLSVITLSLSLSLWFSLTHSHSFYSLEPPVIPDYHSPSLTWTFTHSNPPYSHSLWSAVTLNWSHTNLKSNSLSLTLTLTYSELNWLPLWHSFFIHLNLTSLLKLTPFNPKHTDSYLLSLIVTLIQIFTYSNTNSHNHYDSHLLGLSFIWKVFVMWDAFVMVVHVS